MRRKTLIVALLLVIWRSSDALADVLTVQNSTSEVVRVFLQEADRDTYSVPSTLVSPQQPVDINVKSLIGLYLVVRYPNGFDSHEGYLHPTEGASRRVFEIGRSVYLVRKAVFETKEYIDCNGFVRSIVIAHTVYDWESSGVNRVFGLRVVK